MKVDVILFVTPYSLVEIYQHFKETCLLKMQSEGFSEFSADFHQTTHHHA